MVLDKEHGTIRSNSSLTLAGIPAEAFQYVLGTRTALEWVVDKYHCEIDRLTGATSDPNHQADDQKTLFYKGKWSGREDLNLRPPGPEPGALPGCATPRLSGTSRILEVCSAHILRLQPYHAIRNFRRDGEDLSDPN